MSKKPYGLELFINNLIIQTNELYPNIITEDQKERIYNRFKNDPRIKTIEGYEEVKRIINSIFVNYINKYYSASALKEYNPSKWSDMEPCDEAKYVNDILEVLKEYGEKSKKIVDAGAGSGRNSIYFAQKGYDVTAIDTDINSLNTLKNNMLDYHVNNIEIFNINIIDYLKTQRDGTIDVIIDYGMSHYLNDETKYLYYQLARRKLKNGGLYLMLHYGEFEEDKGIGRSLSDLKKLTLGSEIIMPWQEKTWRDETNEFEIKAFTSILRKQGGNIPTDAIKYMLWLKGNTNNIEEEVIVKNKKGIVKPLTIIITCIVLIIIGFIIGLIIF